VIESYGNELGLSLLLDKTLALSMKIILIMVIILSFAVEAIKPTIFFLFASDQIP
jgi:hypothetical protein